jgi:endonuclease/exonuclease/phosphatase family metal-dependent hydrolase
MVSSLLTVMTWNIWFDKTNRKTRTETLLNEIIFYNPDIVALQEVVQESLEIIIAKMTPTYYIIGMNVHWQSQYDTLILSKFPPLQWNRYHLPKTKMGRNLLLTTLQTPTRQISVGTFHLESVFNRQTQLAEELKTSQLKYIYAISPMNTILMGDTNLVIDELEHQPQPQPQPQPDPKSEDQSSASASAFVSVSVSANNHLIDIYSMSPCSCPQTQPSISIEAHYLGVCPFLKGAGGSPFLKGAGAGATYCGRTNKNIKNKSIQSRLDRIYVKILRNSLKVHFYGLTGTFTQPSDHFGVFSQIEI